MDEQALIKLYNIAGNLFSENYDYYWLKVMLNEAKKASNIPNTLITGSSHALFGIYEGAFKRAINCSMHSQDIYYDFLCAKHVIPSGNFNKCFIVMGYYIPFQDLSKSEAGIETVIKRVYEPIFNNTHNWHNPNPAYSPWDVLKDAGDMTKKICENFIYDIILSAGTYFNDKYRKREPLYDFGGKNWFELSSEQRLDFAKRRVKDHNKFINYKESFAENTVLLSNYIEFLHHHSITPIIVITPFTREYNQLIDLGMKESLLDLLNSIEKEVHFIDFNETDRFDDTDFTDTDHLNEKGAKKLSYLLSEMFGE